MNFKRVFAILAVIALLSLYVITFLLAFCNFPGSDRILGGFIMLDIAVPIVLWILLYVYKHFSSKK